MQENWTIQNLIEQDAGGMEYCLWLEKVGLSESTGYRYRSDGKVATINIEGREFILTKEITRFWSRAKAGEFAKKPRGAAAKAQKAATRVPACTQRRRGHNSTK